MVPDRAPIRSIWIFVRVLDAAKLIEQVDLNNVSNFFPAVSLMLTPDKYSQVENIRGKTNDQHIGKMKPDKALSRNGAADILMTEHYRPPTMQKVFSLGNLAWGIYFKRLTHKAMGQEPKTGILSGGTLTTTEEWDRSWQK